MTDRRDETVADYGPRLAHQRERVKRALEEANASSPDETRRAGLRLAVDVPEIEGLAAARSLAAEGRPNTLGQDSTLGVLLEAVERSPRLGLALDAAFPDLTPKRPLEIVTLLVADPIADETGQPLARRWNIPWRDLEERLRGAAERSGRHVDVRVAPATWARTAEAMAKSTAVVIVCHGSDDGLWFEDGPSCRSKVVRDSEIADLVGGSPPRLVLLMACHGEPLADAIHRAGVRATVGIDRSLPLEWKEAFPLVETAMTSWWAGEDAVASLRRAAFSTTVARQLRVFGSRTTTVAGPGALVDAGVARPPSPGRSIVGRERDLGKVFEVFERPAAITLTGGPGIGKTSLALLVAERFSLRGDPVAMISLEDVEPAGSEVVDRIGSRSPPRWRRTSPTPPTRGSQRGLVADAHC